MFKSKTVIILGAGSSSEVGLPVGDALKQHIADAIDIRFDDFGSRQISGDIHIYAAIKEAVRRVSPNYIDTAPYLFEAWKLRDALPLAISIDNLLDAHKNEKAALCGKLGIIKSILSAERESTLYVEHQNRIPSRQGADTWLGELMKALNERISVENVERVFENLIIVNFNYDRCVEHYLYHSLQLTTE